MGRRIGNLRLVNYKDHPTNSMYKVLNFNSEPEAQLFEKLLIEQNIWYEKDIELYDNEPLYLFAVKNKVFDQVQRLNFEVSAKFRTPIIKNKVVRYLFVGFFLSILLFAIIGYLKSNYN